MSNATNNTTIKSIFLIFEAIRFFITPRNSTNTHIIFSILTSWAWPDKGLFMPKESKLTLKQRRTEQVNQVIRIIGTHGRRFFFNQVADRYASMEVDQRGKVWFIDDYSSRRIFTHKTTWGGRWRGFSHGGTLRSLVEGFRDYIRTGEPMPPGYLGPERFDDSNIWGYDIEGMSAVRQQAGALPVFVQAIKEAM